MAGPNLIRKAWTEQPPPGHGSPNREALARKLAFLWSGADPLRELVTGRSNDTSTTVLPELGPSARGLAAIGDGVTQGKVLTFDSPLGDASGVRRMTVGCLFRMSSLGDTTQRRMFSKFVDGQGSWFVRKRENSGLGTIEVFFQNVDGAAAVGTSSAAIADTDWHLFLATYDGQLGVGWLDGVQQNSFGGGAADRDVVDRAYDISIFGDNAGSSEPSADMPLAFVLNESLTVQEIQSVTENPWGFFFEPRSIWMPRAPAAAGPTGSGDMVAQEAVISGAGVISRSGSGSLFSAPALMVGTGSHGLKGSGSLVSAAATVTGQGLRISTVNVELLAANGRDLRDETGVVLSNLNGIVWEWYDDPDSTAGEPVDSGTFNTNATGEATVVVNGTTLGDGGFGQLILYHPSDVDIRATLRVPVTD